ncbi:hypothetical protein SAMN04487898_10365 [Pedobacter sp. ok626]|nr:hypothetical protein SAMN04487898_10365 [Pedobacter sp. ok626]
MHKIRQILLFLERGVSQRSIEKEVKINRKIIALYLRKFLQTGVDFSELLKRSDQQLKQILGLIKPLVPEDTLPEKFISIALLNTLTKNLVELVCPAYCFGRNTSANIHQGFSIPDSVNFYRIK